MTNADEVRGLVNRAIRAATPAGELVETRLYGLQEPTPLAGLRAALAVAKMAEDQAHTFARSLRGEGRSWVDIADLLEIPWSEEYSRRERAYELVAGAQRSRTGVYWTCGGPNGCGAYVTDHGPYEGHPLDNETGHTAGCRRLEAEGMAYWRAQEEAEERDRVMDEALPKVTDYFGQETVKRVQYVTRHGGRYLGWSTGESLAVALVLDDADALKREGYSTKKAALGRISRTDAWVRQVRLAATGKR